MCDSFASDTYNNKKKSETIIKPRKHLLSCLLILPHNSRPPCIRPRRNPTPKILCTNQKSLTVPSLRIKIRFYRFSLLIKARLNRERPDQLCNAQEQVPFANVDARTESTAGAIAVVVAAVVVC